MPDPIPPSPADPVSALEAASEIIKFFLGMWSEFSTFLFQLPPWQGMLYLVSCTVVIAYTIEIGIQGVTEYLETQFDMTVDSQLVTQFNYLTNGTLSAFGLYLSTLPMGYPDTVQAGFIRPTAFTGIVMVWGYTFYRLGSIVPKLTAAEPYFDDEFIPIFKNVWTILSILVTLYAVLFVWGINILPLLAPAGIAGVVVGFGAKDAITNFFGGISLYIDKTYQKGDFIVLKSGVSGTVTDIGIRSTELLTRENIQVTVPNAVLNSSQIINESRPKRSHRVTVPIGVEYGAEVEEAKDILSSAAEDADQVLDTPAPKVMFSGFGDSALEFEVWCWVARSRQEVMAVDSVNTLVYERLNEAGIEIPYPQRDVHMD